VLHLPEQTVWPKTYLNIFPLTLTLTRNKNLFGITSFFRQVPRYARKYRMIGNSWMQMNLFQCLYTCYSIEICCMFEFEIMEFSFGATAAVIKK